MELEGSFVEIATKEGVIEYLRNKQQNRPFRCPNLLVVNRRIKQGREVFEKGDLICTSGFVDKCCLFERSMAEDGKLVARCSKVKGDFVGVFREC